MNDAISIRNWMIYLVSCLFLASAVFPIIGVSQTVSLNGDTVDYQYHYFTYQEMTDLFHGLADNHSDIMSLTSIGKTYEGRDIWLVKISDNVYENEDELGVLLLGAHHGNEKPSFEILIYFIQHMVENYGKVNTDDDEDGLVNEDPIDGFDNDDDGLVDEDPSEDRVREVVDNTQIFLITMVNPDGVEANTRKNLAPNYGPFGFSEEITSYGVNINRNYGYKWYLYYIFPRSYYLLFNIIDSSPNYRGERPFSENESKSVKNFVETQDISISVSYHSYGEVMFYPWMYTSRRTPDENLFISIGENMSKINNYYLYKGRQYIIPRYGGTLGTSEDWLYGKRGILSFTIELCSKRVPTDPDVVQNVCLKHAGVNLYVCERSWTIEKEKFQVK
ncbi:MAG: hypothetical protein JSW60_05375 [Thermoplasmatales archaeon]|nr:MAG: hypothetical protein JSW60_05375 [Thermoplasmatales archaeon]